MRVSAKREDLSPAPVLTGSYSASLIGTISSHLAGLQGYDVMALELIQNADDAGSDGKGNKATQIVFDVTDEGLIVRNDGEFTYCGALHERRCPNESSEGYACDYHRITEVASGGKLSKSDNIGRFGIGFVSTYQIADHPQVHSAGIQLTLMPERQKWQIGATEEDSGTTFFLPWASDPNSDTRIQLGASAFTSEHIDQLIEDFTDVLRKALLFLRHLTRAELRRNGRLVISCSLDRDKDRDDETELSVSFNSGQIERWVVLRADAAAAARLAGERFPQLAALRRKTGVSIAIRAEPEPVPAGRGLLFAYLPTEQSTGLPVHINADFFPEADRKAVIFSGNQHQQAWNAALIETAAAKLADNLVMLRDKLGAIQLWSLLSSAWQVKEDGSGRYPSVFEAFWEAFKAAVERGAAIAETAAGSFERPHDVLIPRQPLDEDRLAVIQEMGGRIVSETLRPHRNTLVQLGTKDLRFAHLVELMDAHFDALSDDVEPEPEERVARFYRPLWALIESLLPEAATAREKVSVDKVKDIPFIVKPDRCPITINACYQAVPPATAARLAQVPPYLPFASDLLAMFPRLNALIDAYDLAAATRELRHRLIEETTSPEDLLGTDKEQLRELYALLATLPDRERDQTTYQSLRALPIWCTAKGFVSAEQALLPGDFSDPIGQATLIKQNLLNPIIRQFLGEKLGVKRQTIAEYVRVVVPRFIGESGPDDLNAYKTLLETLANHLSLLDDDELRRILAELPMIPTRDGGWSRPDQTYFRSDELVALLGDAHHRWVHVSRAGRSRAIRVFLEALGVRRSPSAAHLALRMLELSKAGPPTHEARQASENAFYQICDLYSSASPASEDVKEAISILAGEACLPAYGEDEDWFAPGDLYAPYRYQAFESQGYVVDFHNTQRLNTQLLEDVGITITPGTELVIDHLLHCVEAGEPAHTFVYQILNERAKEDDPAISRLRNVACIYLEASGTYVRPNRLYRIPQPLGKYTYNVPARLEDYRALFKSLGVKDSPEASDYVDIVLDIVGENFAPQTPLDSADQQIHDTCIRGIAGAWHDGLLSTDDLERLSDAPSVPNARGRLRHPDELLLRDSEYHRGFFDSELDDTLCQVVDPELAPFLAELGLRRLSDVATIELDFVDGPESTEEGICEALMERSGILARMLHDQPRTTRVALDKAIHGLAARSHDTVRIKASLVLDEEPLSSSAIEVKAFYDAAANELILARPITKRSWVQVFSALLHQLMPGESPAHISTLALALHPLMDMSLAEAEEWLAEAHVPCLQVEVDSLLDLSSDDLGGLGTDSDEEAEEQGDQNESSEPKEAETQQAGSGWENVAPPAGTEAEAPVPAPPDSSLDDSDAKESGETGGTGARGDQSSDDGSGHVMPGPLGGGASPQSDGHAGDGGPDRTDQSADMGSPKANQGTRRRRGRSKSKSLWDRELISYARHKKAEADTDSDGSGSEDAKYKLAIEAAARAAVCEYERARGRVPEEMSQTNPGFDIVSRRPGSDDIERYIEVKGTSGEWRIRGVGLSRLQFNNAQELGDRFWLYVVEFALEEEGVRVHALQSPALKVDHFVFDGGWRDVAADEAADPTIGFVCGARIDCGLLGQGTIEDIQERGQTRLILVEFDDGRKRLLPLNLKTMRIIEATDGDDDS